MPTIRFGSNTYAVDRDFTVIGVDERGGLVFGDSGPLPKTPLVWINFKEGGAYLNATLEDSAGEAVLQINDSVITINKDNVYSVEQRPDNQIPPDQVVVTNRVGETALDLRRHGSVWDFNGDFYYRSLHVVATPQGMEINPRAPRVG
jgi:hypothetical protein